MRQEDKKSTMHKLLDVYWFIRKRIRLFFWGTNIVLTMAIGIIIYLNTSSFQHVWVAFIVGPGIMLLAYIGYKVQKFEDKHDLTHHKTYNGAYFHSTIPMKKHSNKNKSK